MELVKNLPPLCLTPSVYACKGPDGFSSKKREVKQLVMRQPRDPVCLTGREAKEDHDHRKFVLFLVLSS